MVERVLPRRPALCMLDCCGGQGRHALELARRAYRPPIVAGERRRRSGRRPRQRTCSTCRPGFWRNQEAQDSRACPPPLLRKTGPARESRHGRS
jgi:hypothetical protein